MSASMTRKRAGASATRKLPGNHHWRCGLSSSLGRLPLVLLPIMSKVIDGYKIYMPTAASKFPYTPDIPNEHMPQPLSSPTPTGHGSTSTKRRRIKEVSAVNQEKEKFRNDPGCFVTGMSDLTLQAAHIVNAARDQSDPSRLPNVVSSMTSPSKLIFTSPSSFISSQMYSLLSAILDRLRWKA